MTDPKIAQKAPYVQDVKPGRYAWCACGQSQSQPFCDGSHKGSGFSPKIVEVSEARKMAWCGCKHSQNPPYCDGSHKAL